jgi:hypothetical protein
MLSPTKRTGVDVTVPIRVGGGIYREIGHVVEKPTKAWMDGWVGKKRGGREKIKQWVSSTMRLCSRGKVCSHVSPLPEGYRGIV